MALILVFAIASNANRQEERNGGKQIDDLPAITAFHLTLVAIGKCGKCDFLLSIFCNEVGGRSQQRDPLIKVIATLPIFASDASRNVAGHTKT